MAEILASALVSKVLGNFNSAALKEIGLVWGLKDELKRVEGTLRTLHAVLQDAEKKQRTNESIQNWLMELKNAAYDAENVLDLITIQGFRQRKGTCYQLCFYFSRPNPLLFRFKIARKVRILRERLNDIVEERNKFRLTEGVSDERVGATIESRQTGSLVNECEIVGMEKEKERIIENLLGKMLDDKLSIYAICGMGGLGKTTLAQLAYNDERAERHFDLRIWVCVSDDFDRKKILSAIIGNIDKSKCNISGLDDLERHLQEKLSGKRFLLVLDDVWNENSMLWEELKKVFLCGLQGSALVVTTRIEKVARMVAGSIPIHHLGYLSETDSWSLFRQRAFATGKEEEESLMKIGKEIVTKCGGVPLAVKALGSLMQNKTSESEWLAIMNNEIWLLPEDENHILPALRLSYDNLKPRMRQCFAYCCIFPKDYRMEEDQLIQLWMANGFLPSEDRSDLYLTGHLIFEELVGRSFFQDVDVNKRSCAMPDLVHDLAQSVMKHEIYIMENNSTLKNPKILRHLSANLRDPVVKLPSIEPNSLRSLVIGIPSEREEDLCPFLSQQRYLRVLELQRDSWLEQTCPSTKLLNLICKLQHLRYLAMSCDYCERLPESLTNLHFLQTLKLTRTYFLLELPKGLKLMKNLWFLDIERHDSLICMPADVGELTCLQELSIFIVGRDSSTQIRQLKELNLGGELSIRGLENVRNCEDAKSANLMGKMNLASLHLSWSSIGGESFEEVLEGLQPHQDLKKLFIKNYGGSRFPNWMSAWACKNLTEISLERCDNCEQLPPLGNLSFLVRLDLYQMNSIKHLGAEWHGNGETSFPALTKLTVYGMPNLEEWTLPDSGKSFPCLQSLQITECPKLNGLPSLPSLKILDIDECDSLTSFPATILQDFSSLKSLSLWDCKRLNPLSGSLQRESTLEDLSIGVCPEFKDLPESLQQLTSLRRLEISRCDPQLEKRCEKWKGQDWPKISHIPFIRINGKTIQ